LEKTVAGGESGLCLEVGGVGRRNTGTGFKRGGLKTVQEQVSIARDYFKMGKGWKNTYTTNKTGDRSEDLINELKKKV